MKKKNLILGGVLALVGLLMTVMPGTCVKAVVVLVGLAAVASGVYNLFTSYKTVQIPEIKKTILIKSIVSIVVGFFAVVFPFALLKTVSSIWKIISFVLGVYLALYSIYSLYSIIKIKDLTEDDKKRIIKESFTTLIVAILLFVIPIETVGATFIRIIGIAGMVIGIFLLMLEFVVSKRTTIIEADEVEVKAEETEEASAESTETTETVEKAETTETKEESAE